MKMTFGFLALVLSFSTIAHAERPTPTTTSGSAAEATMQALIENGNAEISWPDARTVVLTLNKTSCARTLHDNGSSSVICQHGI